MTIKLRWIGMAFLSLAIYALAVWSTDHHRKSQFHPEQFLIASALSHAVHGTPLGGAYRGFLWPIVYQASDNIEHTFEALKHAPRPQGDDAEIWSTVPDGLGIVGVAIISFLFDVFGATLAIFPALAVGFPALSVLCLVLRFPDSRLVVVPFYFLLMSLVLLSPPVVSPTHFNDFAVGGIRFMSLLAILPSIHVALELLDARVKGPPPVGWLATAIQLVLFVSFQNVRGGAAYLLLATATIVIAALWLKAGGLRRRIVAAKALSMIAVLAVATIAIWALAPEDYRREGRVGANFWHRLIVSLGVHPQWPFKDFVARHDLCVPPYGTPMQPGLYDNNGTCVWIHHVRATGMPPREMLRGVYGAEYERLLRAQFFEVLRDHPAEVLEAFFRYKIESAWPAFMETVQFRVGWRDESLLVRQLCVVGLLVLFLWSAWRQTAFRSRQLAAACAVFLAWSFLPILFAWGLPYTMVDSAFWFWATLLGGVVAAVDGVGRRRPAGAEATSSGRISR